MAVNTELEVGEKPVSFAQKVQQKIPLLFAIWMVLTVISPIQDLYKAFFHLIIVPASLFLVFSGRSGINWKDPFLRIALIFFAYTGITTLFIGLGPMENQIRAFRWAVEITLGVIAMFIWMPDVVRKPEWWGRFFLGIALTGATAAVLLYVINSDFEGARAGRLTGLGALYHWVTVSYILLLYFSLGQFLLQSQAEKLLTRDRLLLAASFFTVCAAVLLSQSRTSVAAMVAYGLFIGVIAVVRRPGARGYFVVVSTVGLTGLILILLFLYGLEGYIDRMLERGASQRIVLWTGYLKYMSDAWLLGFGSGTEALFHPAADGYWKPNNLHISHPHNLFLGTLVDTGVIGLGFLFTLIIFLLRGVFRHAPTMEQKIRLLGILGLIFILTTTGSQTSISSIKPVWLYLWIPVIFIWFWSHRAAGQLLNK